MLKLQHDQYCPRCDKHTGTYNRGTVKNRTVQSCEVCGHHCITQFGDEDDELEAVGHRLYWKMIYLKGDYLVCSIRNIAA